MRISRVYLLHTHKHVCDILGNDFFPISQPHSLSPSPYTLSIDCALFNLILWMHTTRACSLLHFIECAAKCFVLERSEAHMCVCVRALEA